MYSLEINYGDLGEPVLIRILQVADQMNVPPRVAVKAWLQTQCELSRQAALHKGCDHYPSPFSKAPESGIESQSPEPDNQGGPEHTNR